MLELPKMYITLHLYLYYTKDKMKCRSNPAFSGEFTWITNNVFAICGRMQIRRRLRLRNIWVLLFLNGVRPQHTYRFVSEIRGGRVPIIDISPPYTVNYPYYSNFKPPFPAAKF